MAREQWAKIDVDMPTDEKLFGRPLLERHLWSCLICLSTKNKFETGDYTIYNLDASALSRRFNLGSTSGVEKGLKYFETCKPRPMIKRKDGAIILLNIEKRQARSKDSPEAHRERQARYRERTRDGSSDGSSDGSEPPSPPPSLARHGVSPRDAEGEGEGDEDQDPRNGKGEKIPSRSGDEERPGAAPSHSWDPALVEGLRTAFGKTELDRRFAGFLTDALRFPRERRDAASREFLARGLAAEGKGYGYLLAMIRDGAGLKRGANGNGGATNGNPSAVPKWKQQGASSAEEYERWLAEETRHV